MLTAFEAPEFDCDDPPDCDRAPDCETFELELELPQAAIGPATAATAASETMA
jgi:hypothetical protein